MSLQTPASPKTTPHRASGQEGRVRRAHLVVIEVSGLLFVLQTIAIVDSGPRGAIRVIGQALHLLTSSFVIGIVQTIIVVLLHWRLTTSKSVVEFPHSPQRIGRVPKVVEGGLANNASALLGGSTEGRSPALG